MTALGRHACKPRHTGRGSDDSRQPEHRPRLYLLKRRMIDTGLFPMEEKPEELAEMNKQEVAPYAEWVKRVNFRTD